jgi:hypothetical protein
MDIRIGTLVTMQAGAATLKQILPHGFESFFADFLAANRRRDIERTAREVKEVIGDRAVISSIGCSATRCRRKRRSRFRALHRSRPSIRLQHGSGFAGALEDRPVGESMPQFKKVWGEWRSRPKTTAFASRWKTATWAAGGHRAQMEHRAQPGRLGNDVQ